jgi:MoaA/NifB/PqqE/SkfB family radical SAM enzyme
MQGAPPLESGDWTWWRHDAYVSLTMEFRCNLRCRHCMIGESMHWLNPVSREELGAVLRQREERGWTGLILTGAEITLQRDLEKMVRQARAAGFRHVRIQTHGMHLANPRFCDRLVEAGVDEFFVSVAGGTAEIHNAITAVPGSFARTLQGLENLERHDVVAITNTVLTRLSVGMLPELVLHLSHLRRLRQMEFWNYFPMSETDEQGLIAPLAELIPPLREAARLAEQFGRRVEIKNVPVCALGAEGRLVENAQPELHIDDRFWDEFARNGFYDCEHRDRCAARNCLGLPKAYTARFGREAELLSPLPGRRQLNDQ